MRTCYEYDIWLWIMTKENDKSFDKSSQQIVVIKIFFYVILLFSFFARSALKRTDHPEGLKCIYNKVERVFLGSCFFSFFFFFLLNKWWVGWR